MKHVTIKKEANASFFIDFTTHEADVFLSCFRAFLRFSRLKINKITKKTPISYG